MKLVVDKMLTGWKSLREEQLLRDYEEIRKVGEREDLPQRFSDKEIAQYCVAKDCAFMTSDARAYTSFLEIGLKWVKIRKYGRNEGDQLVYIIEIVKD